MVLASSCDGRNGDFADLLRLPPEEQEVALQSLDPQAQVDAYIEGIRTWEPPQLHLAVPLSEGGEDVVIAVSRRLRDAKDDFVKERLLFVLALRSCMTQRPEIDASAKATAQEVAIGLRDNHLRMRANAWVRAITDQDCTALTTG